MTPRRSPPFQPPFGSDGRNARKRVSGLPRRVNMAFGNCYAAMTRDLLNREGVCASLTEPSQKRVAQLVYHAVLRMLQILSQLLILSSFLVKMIERSHEIWFARVVREDILGLAFKRAIDKHVLSPWR